MLRFLTAGESHGPELTAILEGLPAGLPIDFDALNLQMARRQKGYGSGGRMKIEKDAVTITSGVVAQHTTGGPIAIRIINRDFEKWRDRDVEPMTVPRPGHADLTGAVKYGYSELRHSLERASARETAARVAVGALCRSLLGHFGVEIGSYVTQIGAVQTAIDGMSDYAALFALAEANDLRCPVPSVVEEMRQHVWEIMQAKDTVGGVFEVVALNVPIGLGSHVHWDRRLSAQLMHAVGSIQAIKGVEIGPAFEMSGLPGTQVHDEIYKTEDGALNRYSNRAGGLEGGITTGQPIVVRAAMKPISTVLNPRRSVDLATGEVATTVYERSDFCAVPRAGVVGEAMMAFVLADSLLQKVGGDSVAEMQPRVATLRSATVDQLAMDNVPWRFRYQGTDSS